LGRGLKENVFEFYSHINYINVDKTTTTENEPVADVAQKNKGWKSKPMKDRQIICREL
jgi:hypothetical protein